MSTRLLPSLLLVALSLAPGSAAALPVPPPPDTLRGRVTTAAGNPVADVEILVPELDRSARTASDGGFVLTTLPPGDHPVVLRRPGYAPVVQPVKLAGPARLDVLLREATFELEPVVVTGMRAPVTPLLSVMPTATLSEDRVRQEQSVSLAHTLESVAGVRTLSTGGEIGKPVIRGLSGSRVLVAEDGSRLEDYSWSDEDGPSIDARLTDRIEVVRGPASVLYGSDAQGGVVNVVTRPHPTGLGWSLGAGVEGTSANMGGRLRLSTGYGTAAPPPRTGATLHEARDLRAGRCVRLLQGSFSDVTCYSSDPAETARGFEADGARWIHVVDLDAAEGRGGDNLRVIRQIRRAVSCRMEVGGGIRSFEAARALLDLGVDRLVVLRDHADEPADRGKVVFHAPIMSQRGRPYKMKERDAARR